MGESSTVEVDLSQLREGWNPRRVFDIKALAEDIGKRGLLVPLEVRLLKKGSYEIVDGARRFRALLGLTLAANEKDRKVRVVLVDATEAEAAVMKFTRFEFSEGITEADRMQALADRWAVESELAPALTQEEFAFFYGVGRSTVANAVRFTEAPKAVRALVEKGKLTPSHVTKAVLKFKTKNEQIAFAKGFADRRFGYGDGTVGQAVKIADQRIKQRQQEAEFEVLRKKADYPDCPQCKSPPRSLTAIQEGYTVDKELHKAVRISGKEVQVFTCSKGDSWNAHHWRPGTGDMVYTQWGAEAKARTLKAAAERKTKSVTTKRKKAKGVGIYEPAWFFSRTSLDGWAKALLAANLDKLHALYYGTTTMDCHSTGKNHLGFPFRIEPAEIDDGDGGKFLTRVLLVESSYRGFKSGAREDHVGAGNYVQIVKTRRTQVLKFERTWSPGPTAKKPEDWLPKSVPFPGKREGAFTLGQRVKLNDDRKSYNGKKARILAFNTYREKLHFALLDISMSQKVFPLDSLTPLEEVEK